MAVVIEGGGGEVGVAEHRGDGGYREGKAHGRGTYTWPEGDRYEGG